MNGSLYERIKELCHRRGITITKLEADLDFGHSSIKKWKSTSSPSIDKVIKVATYFDVSVDYLLGQTNIESSITSFLDDEDIISFQRARQRMTPQDRDRMMQMLKVGFDYAFNNQEDEQDN